MGRTTTANIRVKARLWIFIVVVTMLTLYLFRPYLQEKCWFLWTRFENSKTWRTFVRNSSSLICRWQHLIRTLKMWRGFLKIIAHCPTHRLQIQRGLMLWGRLVRWRVTWSPVSTGWSLLSASPAIFWWWPSSSGNSSSHPSTRPWRCSSKDVWRRLASRNKPSHKMAPS